MHKDFNVFVLATALIKCTVVDGTALMSKE